MELRKCSKQRNVTEAENNIHSITQFFINCLKKKKRSDMDGHVQPLPLLPLKNSFKRLCIYPTHNFKEDKGQSITLLNLYTDVVLRRSQSKQSHLP